MDSNASEKSRSLAKHWIGTCNNYTPLDVMCFAVAIQPLADYYVFGKEIGAGGTPHLQFMVCFKTRKTLAAVKKLIQTQCHWEVKFEKSTFKGASDYCKKGIFPRNACFIYLISQVINLMPSG